MPLKKHTLIIVCVCLITMSQHTALSQEISETNCFKKRNNVVTQEVTNMIEAKTALSSTLKEIQQKLNPNSIVNIIVEPHDTYYSVHLIPLSPIDKRSSESLIVTVDAESGAVTNTKITSSSNPRFTLKKELQQNNIISGIEAYRIALTAIKGFEHYDKFGRLEIHLDGDHYKVTFPDPSARDGDGRAADFTYQVWIDIKTKAVIKILTSS